MPFETAFSMPDAMRAAFAITFSGFEGRRFDWERWAFETKGE
ncbi:MAG: hypothetical protein ACRELF_25255 [Gemmataceae bacterium]